MINSIHIGKLDVAVDVDFSSLPEISKAFIIEYGLKQYLNDAHAGIKREEKDDEGIELFSSDAEFHKAVTDSVAERISNLSAGVFNSRVGGIRDPFKAECKSIAESMLSKEQRKLKGAERNAAIGIILNGGKAEAIQKMARNRIEELELLQDAGV